MPFSLATIRVSLCVLSLCIANIATGVASEGRREVLLYYSNETTLSSEQTKNFTALLSVLRSADRESLHSLADSIEEDSVRFPAVVDSEIKDILHNAATGVSPIDAAIITNRLALTNALLIYRYPEPAFTKIPLGYAQKYQASVLSSSPLASHHLLSYFLEKSAEQFNPENHEFILIVKSHGSGSIAVTPRITVDLMGLTPSAILSLAEDPFGGIKAPSRSDNVGISRGKLIKVVAEVGRARNMRFGLVFLESCSNGLGYDSKQEEATNIEELFTTGGKSIGYSTIDYAKILGRGFPFTKVLSKELSSNSKLTLYRRPRSTMEIIRGRIIYFIPIAAFMTWAILRKLRNR